MKRAALCLVLTGCATSYQSATAHQVLGPGAYLITADGNGWTGSSTIEHYKYRRATELCPSGFDVIDANQSMRTHVGTFDGGKTYQTINKPSGSLAIRCRVAVRAPAMPPRAPTPTSFWCSTNIDVDIGNCFDSLAMCSGFRSAMLKDCPPGGTCQTTECEAKTTAFCAPQTGCYSTQTACFRVEQHAKRDGSACAVRQ